MPLAAVILLVLGLFALLGLVAWGAVLQGQSAGAAVPATRRPAAARELVGQHAG